eukprot:jgi/Mesvir1/24891/Mv22114-RA.1
MSGGPAGAGMLPALAQLAQRLASGDVAEVTTVSATTGWRAAVESLDAVDPTFHTLPAVQAISQRLNAALADEALAAIKHAHSSIIGPAGVSAFSDALARQLAQQGQETIASLQAEIRRAARGLLEQYATANNIMGVDSPDDGQLSARRDDNDPLRVNRPPPLRTTSTTSPTLTTTTTYKRPALSPLMTSAEIWAPDQPSRVSPAHESYVLSPSGLYPLSPLSFDDAPPFEDLRRVLARLQDDTCSLSAQRDAMAELAEADVDYVGCCEFWPDLCRALGASLETHFLRKLAPQVPLLPERMLASVTECLVTLLLDAGTGPPLLSGGSDYPGNGATEHNPRAGKRDRTSFTALCNAAGMVANGHRDGIPLHSPLSNPMFSGDDDAPPFACPFPPQEDPLHDAGMPYGPDVPYDPGDPYDGRDGTATVASPGGQGLEPGGDGSDDLGGRSVTSGGGSGAIPEDSSGHAAGSIEGDVPYGSGDAAHGGPPVQPCEEQRSVQGQWDGQQLGQDGRGHQGGSQALPTRELPALTTLQLLAVVDPGAVALQTFLTPARCLRQFVATFALAAGCDGGGSNVADAPSSCHPDSAPGVISPSRQTTTTQRRVSTSLSPSSTVQSPPFDSRSDGRAGGRQQSPPLDSSHHRWTRAEGDQTGGAEQGASLAAACLADPLQARRNATPADASAVDASRVTQAGVPAMTNDPLSGFVLRVTELGSCLARLARESCAGIPTSASSIGAGGHACAFTRSCGHGSTPARSCGLTGGPCRAGATAGVMSPVAVSQAFSNGSAGLGKDGHPHDPHELSLACISPRDLVGMSAGAGGGVEGAPVLDIRDADVSGVHADVSGAHDAGASPSRHKDSRNPHEAASHNFDSARSEVNQGVDELISPRADSGRSQPSPRLSPSGEAVLRSRASCAWSSPSSTPVAAIGVKDREGAREGEEGSRVGEGWDDGAPCQGMSRAKLGFLAGMYCLRVAGLLLMSPEGRAALGGHAGRLVNVLVGYATVAVPDAGVGHEGRSHADNSCDDNVPGEGGGGDDIGDGGGGGGGDSQDMGRVGQSDGREKSGGIAGGEVAGDDQGEVVIQGGERPRDTCDAQDHDGEDGNSGGGAGGGNFAVGSNGPDTVDRLRRKSGAESRESKVGYETGTIGGGMGVKDSYLVASASIRKLREAALQVLVQLAATLPSSRRGLAEEWFASKLAPFPRLGVGEHGEDEGGPQGTGPRVEPIRQEPVV